MKTITLLEVITEPAATEEVVSFLRDYGVRVKVSGNKITGTFITDWSKTLQLMDALNGMISEGAVIDADTYLECE